jgi:hypothetical protein
MFWFMLLAVLAVNPVTAGVLEHAQELVAHGPRKAGSAGGVWAQDWVADKLRAQGYEPIQGRSDLGQGAVLGCTGDPNGAGWLLAHTDTVHPSCPGAVDNAGAVAIALEVARRLQARPPDQPVCVVFPDGEELDLRASRLLAQRFRPAWVLAMDLVGQGEPTVMGLGPGWGTAGLTWLSNAGLVIPWAYRIHARLLPGQERSDHGPFSAMGIPGFLILGRGPGGIYWPYHTVHDDLDRLEPQALARTTEVVEGLLRTGPPDLSSDPAIQLPWTHLVMPGFAVTSVTILGLIMGAWGGRRGGWAALRGLGKGVSVATVGGAAWLVALHGRPAEGAMATPGLLAWSVAAIAVLVWIPHRSGDARGGALLAVVFGIALFAIDVLLALPFAVAAAGLSLAARWPSAAVLALPLPFYLTWPSHWREMIFHGLIPPSVWVWIPVLALLWAPVLCACPRRPARPVRWAMVGIALVTTLWAGLQPTWTETWFAREVLWPR